MVNRKRVALAVLTAFSLLPFAAYAGSGGTPTAPAAGKSTDYCCQVWDTVQSSGNGKPFTFLNGKGCSAIAENELDRNMCPYTVAKCRGELFTPTATTDVGTGKVDRCLTP